MHFREGILIYTEDWIQKKTTYFSVCLLFLQISNILNRETCLTLLPVQMLMGLKVMPSMRSLNDINPVSFELYLHFLTYLEGLMKVSCLAAGSQCSSIIIPKFPKSMAIHYGS